MTDELRHLVARLTCHMCVGEGTLHSRASTYDPDGTLIRHETHRPCHLCGGFGHVDPRES